MGCLQPETEAIRAQPGHALLHVHSAQHNGVGKRITVGPIGLSVDPLLALQGT